MKKEIYRQLILLFVICISVVSLKGQYIPIPLDSSAYWRVDYYNIDDCGPNQPNASFQYRITGDTLINGITYKKVTSDGYTNCIYLGYNGAIRLDSFAHKIYIIPKDSTLEALLYNFDLNVGDTFPDPYHKPGDPFFGVSYIDTVIYGGISRRRINCESLPSGVIGTSCIEGIGNLTGLVSPIWGANLLYQLVCSSDSGNIIYTNGGPCNIINIIDNGEIIPNFEIKYVPLNKNIHIISDTKIIKIKIYNILGALYKEVSEQNIYDIFIGIQKCIPGIVVVSLVFEDGNAVSKKVFVY